MSRSRLLCQTFAAIAVLLLFGCGSFHNIALYEPSTPEKVATFVPGNGCAIPRYRLGTVSNTRKAMVFIDVKNGGDEPLLILSVTIQGNSKFKFLDDQIIISGVERRADSAIVKMNNFRFSTGGGHYSERDFRPLNEFVGPPRTAFKPYYPENRYESEQWSFSSEMTLRLSGSDHFSVQIPNAVIDGESLSFPLVTFRRREIGYRILCLK